VSDANGNANLNAALAKLQATLPKISKGETGEVSGQTKDGRPFKYSYKYADLAAISAAVMPALGAVGLAFTAKPTLSGGQFVLAYSLLHESGEHDDGEYPLPSQGTPQAIGSAITYARRYCLCAVTGIAPDEDDDGVAAGEIARMDRSYRQESAGEAFQNAAPAPPRTTRPAPAEAPAANGSAPGTEADPSQGWIDSALQRAAGFKAEDAGRELWREVAAKRKDGAINGATAHQLGELIQARIEDLAKPAMEGVVVGLEPGDPWADKVAEIVSADDAEAALADLVLTEKTGHITRDRAAQIRAAIEARAASLTGAAA